LRELGGGSVGFGFGAFFGVLGGFGVVVDVGGGGRCE